MKKLILLLPICTLLFATNLWAANNCASNPQYRSALAEFNHERRMATRDFSKSYNSACSSSNDKQSQRCIHLASNFQIRNEKLKKDFFKNSLNAYCSGASESKEKDQFNSSPGCQTQMQKLSSAAAQIPRLKGNQRSQRPVFNDRPCFLQTNFFKS